MKFKYIFIGLLFNFLSITSFGAGSGAFPNSIAFQQCEQEAMQKRNEDSWLLDFGVCVHAMEQWNFGQIVVWFDWCTVPMGDVDYFRDLNKFYSCVIPMSTVGSPTSTTLVNNLLLGNRTIQNQCGSVINPSKKTVSESIPIDGTEFSINYSSEFNSSRIANKGVYQEIKLESSLLTNRNVKITNISQDITYGTSSFSIGQLSVLNWPWDEVSGLITNHPALKTGSFSYQVNREALAEFGGCLAKDPIFIEYTYVAENATSRSFSTFYGGSTCTAAPEVQDLSGTQRIAVYHPEVWGMHGWTVDEHHFFDRDVNMLYKGNGEKILYNTHQTVTISPYGQVDLVSRYEDDNLFIFSLSGEHLETRSKLLGKLVRKFTYDSSHKLTAITDKFNKQTQFVYYPNGTLNKIIAPYGQETLFTVNSNLITNVQNALGNNYGLQYNSQKLLTQFTKPSGETTTFNYDPSGDFLSESKNSGLTQNFTQTFIGLDKVFNYITSGGLKTISTTSENGLDIVTQTQDGNGVITSSIQDLNAETIQTSAQGIIYYNNASDPIWGASKNFASPYKEVVSGNNQYITYQPYNYNTYTYSNSANATTLTGITNTVGSQDLTSTWTSVLNVSQKKIVIKNSSINIPTNFILSGDETLSRIEPTVSYPVSFTYDADGRVTRSAKVGDFEDYEYDNYGYLKKITNSKGEVTQFTNDAQGKVLLKTLPNSEQISFDYTQGRVLQKLTTPSSQDHNFATTIGDFLNSYLNPSGGTTSYSYNADKQISQITLPSAQTINYQYDLGNGNLQQVITATGNYIYNSVDSVGRPLEVTSPDGIKLQLTWVGRKVGLITWIDSDNSVIGTINTTYGTSSYKPDFFVINSTLPVGMTYSSATGRLTNLALNGSTYNYTYSNTADSNGIKDSKISISGIPKVYYQEIDADSGATPTKVVYLEAKTNGTTLAKVNMKRKFDNFGQAKEYITTINNQSTNAFISGRQLLPSYDSNGRMIRVEKTQQSLVSGNVVTTTDYFNHYSYPLGSNNNMKQFKRTLTLSGPAIKQTDATHAADDRLLSLSGDTTRSYVYNLDGQMSSMTDSTGTTTYSYDAFGNLKAVTLPNTTLIEYKIDPFNRRVKKLVNGNVVEYYLWYDSTHIAAILDASKTIQVAYFYGPGSNAPSYIYKNGITYRVAQDPALGSIRYVIHPTTSQIAQEIEYDENGNMLTNTSPGFQPIGYAGGLYDSDTKLIRFGARDYDPSIGRWTSKDPIGFNGGDTNLYAYVGGDPMSYIDPEGTFLVPVAVGMFIGAMLTPTPIDQQITAIGEGIRVATGAFIGGATAAYLYGTEFVFGSMRFAPFGNRSGKWQSELPHYHRRGVNPNGETIPGQGIGRHRPWDTKSTDTNFCDKF